jgi:murein DD-endopeptidase MepM/ murein hydrolase activator NlpD
VVTPVQLTVAGLSAVIALATGLAGAVSNPAKVAALSFVRSATVTASAAPTYGTYAWPAVGPVTRPFEPSATPYSAGHRGIDIAVPFGSPLSAAADGVVAFAGWVAGSQFISIDHADGVRTTYSWLSSVAVAEGQHVVRGEVIGATGQGHPDIPQPHLHFGARVGSTYIDPMLLLERGSVAGLIHLAPL